jgi:hypothetical protein
MTKSELLAKYKYSDLSSEDGRTFDRWLKGTGVIAAIFTVALVIMALNTWGSPGPATATARSAMTDQGLSVRHLMIRVSRDLPVQVINDPF